MSVKQAVADEGLQILEMEARPAQMPAVAQSQTMAAAPADAPFRAVELAVERGMPLEVIEKLIAAAERMEAMRERERLRQAELAFRRDFSGFRGENVIVPKSKHVDRGRAGSFYQAEFEGVCRLLSPALSKHGFGFRHDMRFGTRKWATDGVESDIPWVYVTCYLEHREGHVETLELEGPTGDGQANTPVQNMQTTASFLKRQSLLAITGTATGGEDDESRLKHNEAAEGKRGEFDDLLGGLQAAAVDGTASLNAKWGSLTAHQRTIMAREFGKLKKDAADADKPIDHTREQRK